MSDITLLGIVCVGLGLYCLHLRKRMQVMNRAGLHMVEMMIRYIVANEECTLAEAATILQRVSKSVSDKNEDVELLIKVGDK